MAMTREELFKRVLKDMGENVEGMSGEDIYNLAVTRDLTTKTKFEDFKGSQTATREEAALVMGRALEEEAKIAEAGSGVDYAMQRGLYRGIDQGGARGTGREEFRRSYYEGSAGIEFRAELARLRNETVQADTGQPDTGRQRDSSIKDVRDDPDVADAQKKQDAKDALEIIKDKLRLYGLEGLADLAHEMLLNGDSAESVVLQLYDTPEFANRFPGMQMRRDNRMSAISPGEYIDFERKYKEIMMKAGIPEGFYDSPEDFAEFIGNDVMPSEMRERVDLAATAVQAVDPNLKTQLRDFYGIGVENDGELVAYFLDPDRAVTVIEQRLQLEAAGLSAAALGTLGTGFERATAEQLADLNVQRREITERLQGQRGLTQQMIGEEDVVTTSELAAAEFGLDSEATTEIARLRQQRQQRGRRQMGALVTGAGATGLGRAT